MSYTETNKQQQAGGKALVPFLLSCAFLSLINSSHPPDLIRKRHLGQEPELDSEVEEEEGREEETGPLLLN